MLFQTRILIILTIFTLAVISKRVKHSCPYLDACKYDFTGITIQIYECNQEELDKLLFGNNYTRAIKKKHFCEFQNVSVLDLILRSKSGVVSYDSCRAYSIARSIRGIHLLRLYFLDAHALSIQSATVDLSLRGGDDFLGGTISLYFSKIKHFSDSNARLVKTCQELTKTINSSFGFIFQTNDEFNLAVTFSEPRVAHPICPLVFRNALLSVLNINYLIDSYFFKNLIKFENSSLISDLNCSIGYLYLNDIYEIDVDSNLLNERVFKKTSTFVFRGWVRSISEDAFVRLETLSAIKLHPVYGIEMLRRYGIKWIRAINSNVSVNLSNAREFRSNENRLKTIDFYHTLNSEMDVRILSGRDEDFCLFSAHPFRQLVVFTMSELVYYKNYNFTFSCTFLWLFKYYREIDRFRTSYQKVYPEDIKKMLQKANFTECQFAKRLERCKKTDIGAKNKQNVDSKLTLYDLLTLFELTSQIGSVMISVYGIVTNILVIAVIVDKRSKKLLGQKHYTYMTINSVSNITILLIQLLELMSECEQPFGFYCSSIRTNLGIQYFKIVVGEYLIGVLRLVSNFSYVGFALNRLSKIGKDHDKVTRFIADVKIKWFLLATIAVNAGLSVVKPLKFDVNRFRPEKPHPMAFSQNYERATWMLQTKYLVVLVFDFLYDVLNYAVFTLVSLTIDVVLLRRLERVMRQKCERLEVEMPKSNEREKEKRKKSYEESKRNALVMVVINSLVNVFAKIPLAVTSLNDLRLQVATPRPQTLFMDSQTEINWYHQSFFFSFKYFCSLQKTCLVFNKFGNLFYLVSLSFNFEMLKRFDSNFALAYQLKFSSNKVNVSQN